MDTKYPISTPATDEADQALIDSRFEVDNSPEHYYTPACRQAHSGNK